MSLADMPTVAPGWPNPYSSHEMSTDTVVRSNLAADDSELQKQQKATGKATTEIGKTHNINCSLVPGRCSNFLILYELHYFRCLSAELC